jgi:hypothetical protein
MAVSPEGLHVMVILRRSAAQADGLSVALQRAMRTIVVACLASLSLGGCIVGEGGAGEQKPGSKSVGVPGSGGVAPGLVLGDNVADVLSHLDERFADFAALGVKFLRVEIVGSDYSKYRTLIDAANARGIQVLALVQSTTIGMAALSTDPEVYASALGDAMDRLTREIPNLRYIEVENEPDVYDFAPLGNPETSRRLALVMTRVYERFVTTHDAATRPLIVGFDFSRCDEPAFAAVYNADSISNHRNYFRQAHGMRDGLPVDIVSIHGYGDKAKIPSESGYSYNGTFTDGLGRYFGQTFAAPPSARSDSESSNTTLISSQPVWITEVGFGWQPLGGGSNGLARQATAIHEAFDALRQHPEVAAAFYYDYRDDEPGGSETLGLRGNQASGYVVHPGYTAYQQEAGQ